MNWCRDLERSYYGKFEKIIVPATVFLTLLLAAAFIAKMTVKGKLTHLLLQATRKHFEVAVGNGGDETHMTSDLYITNP